MIGLGKWLCALAIVVLTLNLGESGVSAEPDYDETKLQAFVSALRAADRAGRRGRMRASRTESTRWRVRPRRGCGSATSRPRSG